MNDNGEGVTQNDENIQPDRDKIKEERRLRNKQKKELRKQLKQKEFEQRQLISKLQPKSNNVTVISRDLADKVVGNVSVVGYTKQDICINSGDFPMLGAAGASTRKSRKGEACSKTTESFVVNEKKKSLKINLAAFLQNPPVVRQINEPIVYNTNSYGGNSLDSDMPIRMKGKVREIPKVKKPSKLKRDILGDECAEGVHFCFIGETDLCDNIVTQDLNALVSKFLSSIVSLQEKLYKRDPIKGTIKRRYVAGLHEIKKYLKLNKVKILIVTTDIKLVNQDGALNTAVEQIIHLAKTNSVPYLFALKRRELGILTKKYIPMSCVAVLNYEGLEDHFNNITKLLPLLKKQPHDPEDDVRDEANSKLLSNLLEAIKCE